MKRLTEEVQIGPFAALKDKAEAVPGAFGTYDCFYAHEMAVTRLKRYEDTGLEPEEIMERLHPDNPPLTLEELREITEPVWIERRDGGTSRWAIVGDFKSPYGVYFGTGAGGLRLNYDECGTTWLAYRRKPEEGTP